MVEIGFIKNPRLHRFARPHPAADPTNSSCVKSNNPFDSDDESDKQPIHRAIRQLFKSNSDDPPNSSCRASHNPFDSDDESDKQPSHRPNTRPSSKPTTKISDSSMINPFGDDNRENRERPSHKPTAKPSPKPTKKTSNSSMINPFGDDDRENREREVTLSGSQYSMTYAERKRYKNGFRDSGGVENRSVEDLENYAVYKAEETTKTVNNCLKITEEMREDATQTLITLHHQGEQITRTHEEAVNIDYHLTRGEKLLGSLGGIFSKAWKPKWTPPIKGPATLRGDPVSSKDDNFGQREKLGLTPIRNGRSKSQPPPEPTIKLQKVEVEKMKQDDALSDLSNLLGELKVMAIDMGSEIDRHNKALDRVDDDVGVLNERVQYANRHGQQLLRK